MSGASERFWADDGQAGSNPKVRVADHSPRVVVYLRCRKNLAPVYDLYCRLEIEVLRSDHEYSVCSPPDRLRRLGSCFGSSRAATDVWIPREDNRSNLRNCPEHGWPQSDAGPPSVSLCARIRSHSHSPRWRVLDERSDTPGFGRG